MAQQVLPIIGGIVGFIYGGPTGAQIGFMIGGGVAALTAPPSPGPQLGDLPVQSFDEGTPRAIIYGTSQTTGYVIAAGPAIKTTEITDAGGKGGGSVEGEVAYRSYAIAMCEGPIAGVLRVWADDKLVYDVRPESLIREQSQAWASNKVFYLGTEDQLPDVFLQLNVTGVDTPAYRGTAYMVVGLEDLTDRRGTVPMYRFEVCKEVETGNAPLIEGPVSSTPGACLSLGSNGLPYFNESGWGIDPGQQYVVKGYNAGFEEQSSVGYTNAGDTTFGDKRIWPTFCTADGFSVSVDENSGTCRSFMAGELHAYYKPTLSAPPSWFYAQVDSRYGSNIFLHEQTLYIGTGVSGSTPTPWNRIMAFNATISNAGVADAHNTGAVLPISAITDVSPDTVFWMHVSRAGNVRVISSDGQFKRYSSGLVFQADEDLPAGLPSLPFNYGTLYGFGVDEDKDLIAFITHGTSPAATLRIFRRSTLELQASFVLTGATTDSNLNRILFSDDALYIQHTRRIYRVGLGSSSGRPTTLDVIVADLCERSGLDAADFDVSELTDSVDGLTLAGDYTAASAIDVTRSCYFFDKCEPGDKLYFPKRGKPVVLTLDIDDLVEIPDLSRREQAAEVPKKIHLHYANATAGYAPIKSTYMRSSADVQSTLETTVQVPVVLDTDQAAQMVEKMFKVTTADAQGEIKISVPDSFIRLVVSDCIGLNLRGQVRRLRIDDIEMADGVMHLTCRADRQSAYTSVLTGIPVDPPTVPPSTQPGDTVFAVMDIPARVDSEDDLNYLVAGTSDAEGWSGWAYQRSLDGGANFSTVSSISTPAIIGRLLGSVSAASPWYTDRVNVVRVQLYRDGQVLEDLTEQQFLSEGGAFALQGEDGWEVLQYMDAEDEGSGVFRLSTLHRGQLNTPAGAHRADALFVMLDRATHIPAQAAWLGQNLTHRGVSLGRTPEGAAELTETFTGQSQREWPVASLRMTRSGDSITATWAPRHRFGSDDQPIASVNFTGFRVVVTDGSRTHTVDVTEPTYTHSVAGWGPDIEVIVYALNRITGPGPGVSTSGEYIPVDPAPTGGVAQGIGAIYAASDAGYVVLLDAVNYEVDGSGTVGPVNLYVLEGDMSWFGGGTVVDSRVVLESSGEPTGLSCMAGVAYTSHIDRSSGASSVVSRIPFAGGTSLAVSHTWTSLQPVTGIVAAHGKVWVADGYNGRIVILDPDDLSEVGTIAQPAYAMAANNTHVFAGLATQVVRIDPATNTVIGPVFTHADDRGVVFSVQGERLYTNLGGVNVVDMTSGTVLASRSDVASQPRAAYGGKVAQAVKGTASSSSPYADRAKLLLDGGDLRTLASFLHPNASANPLNGVRALVMLANGQAIASVSRDHLTNASSYVELFNV